MRVTSFHFMPYRELPADFAERYPSSFVEAPWWELGDADKVGQYYSWSLDELMHAARLGFDGVGTNEQPSFAPNGRHIAFTSTRAGKTQVFTMARDGKDVRQVTRDGSNYTPNWSN